ACILLQFAHAHLVHVLHRSSMPLATMKALTTAVQTKHSTGTPTQTRERALLVGATLANERDEPQDAGLNELRALAETAGAEVVGPPITQKLQTPNPAHYIGKGKLEEIQHAVQ